MAGANVTKIDRPRHGGQGSTLDFIPSEMTSFWQVSDQWGNMLPLNTF